MRKSFPIVACALLVTNSLVTPGFAAKLGDFEKAATQDNSEKKDKLERRHRRDQSSEQGLDDSSDHSTADMFGYIIAYPGLVTLARVRPRSDATFSNIESREVGSPDVPFIRADVNYQHVHSDMTGVDGRVQVGYGPLGLQYRQTHYSEKLPKDSLDLIQMHGLYRVAPMRFFEFDLGFGALIVDREKQSSGFSMTYPLTFYPSQHMELNFSPTWSWIHGNMVSDYDESISYVHQFYSVRLGYRRTRADGETLAGPYVGISYHY